MALDPKHTAIVLIEYQNDVTSEGGALHDAVAGVMQDTGMMDNTRRLVDAARRAGATIVHAPITFAPGYNEIAEHPYGILKGVVDCTAFLTGEWFDYPMFSDVMTSDALAGELGAAPVAM